MDHVLRVNGMVVRDTLRALGPLSEPLFAVAFWLGEEEDDLAGSVVTVATAADRRRLWASGSTPYHRFLAVWNANEYSIRLEVEEPRDADSAYRAAEVELAQSLAARGVFDPPLELLRALATDLNASPPDVEVDDPFVAFVFDLE